MALTKTDLHAIKKLFDDSFDERIDSKGVVTRKDIPDWEQFIKHAVNEAIEEKRLATKEDISHLPTKEEYARESSKLYKEVTDYREEQTILSHQVSSLADRVSGLEN